MYILLVGVDMQLKATAMLIPRDAIEESSATLENRNKSQNCVQRRKKQDHASLLVLRLEISCQYGCILMIHEFHGVSNFKFYVGWVGTYGSTAVINDSLSPQVRNKILPEGQGCRTL
jgi:hypothetical protein